MVNFSNEPTMLKIHNVLRQSGHFASASNIMVEADYQMMSEVSNEVLVVIDDTLYSIRDNKIKPQHFSDDYVIIEEHEPFNVRAVYTQESDIEGVEMVTSEAVRFENAEDFKTRRQDFENSENFKQWTPTVPLEWITIKDRGLKAVWDSLKPILDEQNRVSSHVSAV